MFQPNKNLQQHDINSNITINFSFGDRVARSFLRSFTSWIRARSLRVIPARGLLGLESFYRFSTSPQQ